MTDQFSYSLIRYVGDPVRGEATNIGVAVVGPEGESRLKTNAATLARLQRLSPHFNRHAVRALIRDLEHRIEAQHQVRIEEGDRDDRDHQGAASGVLTALSETAVNDVQVSPPAVWRAEDIKEATTALFERYVGTPRRQKAKGRYLTRANLRDMIHGILEEWAESRNLTVQSNTEIDGRLAPHRVDVVVWEEDGTPDVVMLAVPLRAREAPLIRDSLPAAVADMRASLPYSTFVAVLPDLDEQPDKAPAYLDADGTRRFLKSADSEIAVVPLSELSAYLQTQYRPKSKTGQGSLALTPR